MMTSLRSGPLLSFQFSHTFSPPKRPSISFKTSRSISISTIAMAGTQIVEHVVLFKVKPETEPSKVESMLAGLNGLADLSQVLHLTAGPVHRTSSSLDLSFTHMLHSRYASKDDLADYSASPSHMSVVKQSVLPICEDIMAVDWIDDEFNGAVVLERGSGIRVTFLKPKERFKGRMDEEIVRVMRQVKVDYGEADTVTCGLNFSPERAKGFSIGRLWMCRGVEKMKAVDPRKFLAKSMPLYDEVLVVDYVVP